MPQWKSRIQGDAGWSILTDSWCRYYSNKNSHKCISFIVPFQVTWVTFGFDRSEAKTPWLSKIIWGLHFSRFRIHIYSYCLIAHFYTILSPCICCIQFNFLFNFLNLYICYWYCLTMLLLSIVSVSATKVKYFQMESHFCH